MTTITDLETFDSDNPGAFKLLKPYSDAEVWKRLGTTTEGGDPLLALLCRQLPRKALKAPTIHAKGEEKPHELSSIFREKLEAFEGEILNVIESDLAFGEGLLTFTLGPKPSNKEMKQEYYFEGFYKEQYKPSIERDNSGKITYCRATKSISGQSNGLVQHFGKSNKSIIDNGSGAALKNIPLENMLLVGSIPSKVKGDFRPWIGPIWDDSYGWSKISFSAVLFCIRVGPGLFVFRATPAFIKKNGGLIDEMMGKYAGEVTIISLPIVEGIDDSDPRLEQVEATQVNFPDLKAIPLGRIAAYTGMPQAALEGVTLGQQIGAEYTQDDEFEVYQIYQTKFDNIYVFCAERLRENDPDLSGLPEDIEVKFENRIEQTEIGKADLDTKKMDLVEKFMKYVDDPKDAFEFAGLNLGEIKVKKPDPVELGNSLNPNKPGAGDSKNGEPKQGSNIKKDTED